MTNDRPYPELLNNDEQRDLLERAEHLWSDLQRNELGGFSNINRPFYILGEFKRVIEHYGKRDVGLQWSKDQLDAHPDNPDKIKLTSRLSRDETRLKEQLFQLREEYQMRAKPIIDQLVALNTLRPLSTTIRLCSDCGRHHDTRVSCYHP